MKTFTKKYQLWTFVDSAYTFEEFDTLQECIEAPKYSEWYITKKVSLSVTEAETEPYVRNDTTNPIATRAATITSMGNNPVVEPNAVELTDAEIAANELAAKYATGSIAMVN